MLAGMVQQPLAKADPADMWFAWSLLCNSGKEFDWLSETLAWDLLYGSVPQPAKADPDDTLAWDMLAGMVQQPLTKADSAELWFAWGLLAGSAVATDWESEMLAWDLLSGMIKHPLPKADPADMWFAWSQLKGCAKETDWESQTLARDFLKGSVTQPLAPADPADMWFAWGLLADSHSKRRLGLAWKLLAGMVQKPLAKADPSDMWFAWDMLAGSALPTVVTLKPIRVDWASDTLTWDLLAGSVPQPAKADPADMWFAWDLLEGSASSSTSIPQVSVIGLGCIFANNPGSVCDWDLVSGWTLVSRKSKRR
jgi:hypothetical protein